MNFVSEKEIEATRGDDSGEPVDNRPLYDRLKEVRDKAQSEKDESRKLKNQFRGLDTEETDFLEMVGKAKEQEEIMKKRDEEEILRACRKATIEQAIVPTLDAIKPSTNDVSAKRPSKQASILSSAIRKRNLSDDSNQQIPSKKPELEQPQPMGRQTTSLQLMGVLPGIGDYSASSDDEDNSDSSESGDELVSTSFLPSLQSVEKDNGQPQSNSKTAGSKCVNSGTVTNNVSS